MRAALKRKKKSFKSIAQNNKKADVIYNGMLHIGYQLVTDYP